MNRWIACAALSALGFFGCGSGDDAMGAIDGGAAARTPFTLEQAKDPEMCKSCHPNAYAQWASSMHAYASKDPVFVAMNKRGQRETNGQLGDFCLKCHAPMAVLDSKLTSPTEDLTTLPATYQGVTCYTCHNVQNVVGDHNAMLTLGNDVTMGGPIKNPKQPGVHKAAYNGYLDDGQTKNNDLCGGCHDIQNPNGVHIERTFEEYKTSIYAANNAMSGGGQTCAGCHMDGHEGQLAADDPESHVGVRTVHDHIWPAVDVALTDFPNKPAQQLAVQCALARGTLTFEFLPNLDAISMRATPGAFSVVLETQAGHRQPSGAAQDRRMWWKMQAFDSTGTQLPSSTGIIADGAIEEPANNPDKQLWMFHDTMFDANGQVTHDFWNAAMSTAHPSGYQEPLTTMPTQVSTDASVPHYAQRSFRFTTPGEMPGQTSRLVGELYVRPIGQDVLQDLVASGDLDPSIPALMPTFPMAGTAIDWKNSDASGQPIMPQIDTLHCPESYLCLYQPGSAYCDKLAMEQ